jgi:superfamily II DNA or RNA helicase
LISLFQDQEDVRGKLRVALRSSAAVLVFAPTGFGKTVLAAALIKSIFDAGKRVIFCVHRVDLIVQTAKTFEKFGIPFSYIANGYHYNQYHRVFIASIQTLKNRMMRIPASYIMVDEAHLSMAAGWFAVAQFYKKSGAKLIGLTGSPQRLDGKPLGDAWDVMVMGPSLNWLIETGRLQRYRAFAPAGLNLAGLRIRGGEYVQDDLEALMAGRAVVANAVSHWKALAPGKRTIGFCPSVASAEQHAFMFREAGINAIALDATTQQNDRRAAFMDFADRKLDLIFNCSLFCEGFDLSAQVDRPVTIECVLDDSPTQSLAKHLQKHGRGLRRDETDEPHILLDMVGGFSRLGLPDDDREWTLEGLAKSESEVENVTCPKCFASHRPAPKCTGCGHVYTKKKEGPSVGRIVQEVNVSLEEINLEAARVAAEQDHTEKFWNYWQARAGERGEHRGHRE